MKAIDWKDFSPNQSSSFVFAKQFEPHLILKDSMIRPDGTAITAKRGYPAFIKNACSNVSPDI